MFDDVPAGQLAPELANALTARGFEALTPIQRAVLDPALAERCQHAFTLNEGQLSD